MSPWIVIDLRNNRCAIGLLSTAQHQVRWHPVLIDMYVTPEAYDSRAEIDLSFYRGQGKQVPWRPIAVDALADLPQSFEKIPALFGEPLDRLRKIVPVALWHILSPTLAEHPDVPLVFVVDSIDGLRSLIEEFIGAIGKSGQVYHPTTAAGSLAAFALLDPQQEILPTESLVLPYRVRGRRDSPEPRSFVWTQDRFEAAEANSPSLTAGIPWDSEADINRAGTALFMLFWQERIRHYWKSQDYRVQTALQSKRDLRDRLRQHLSRLRDV